MDHVLKDDKLYHRLLQFGPLVSEFIGQLYSDENSSYTVSIGLTHRFLKLKSSIIVGQYLRDQLHVLARSWADDLEPELVGLGYMHLWTALDSKSFNEIAVDDNRDISHLFTPFINEYAPYFTPQQSDLVMRFLHLISELAEQELPERLLNSNGLFLDEDN